MGWTEPKPWTSEKLFSADMNVHLRDNLNFLKVNIALEGAVLRTIETIETKGVIVKTKAFHKVDTEGSGATDDLDTINGGSEGDVIILRANHTERTVVIKNGTGNIICSADRSLDNTADVWVGIFDGTNWLEIAFADNGA